ncbi:ParB/RepB/Spo0J family partition protein [Klugiella xanthotipulae]|uniref:ParB family chromosome partitioning protein n=1 Tax=Klugiella xanthotipulae TaxID=244735 RepID=A0A543I6V5_9MICO|nr:ParB/RepB/Spo0J family partition protein [Klugiella xanthotipulae]TQM66308.1 ParB family chromosome partitioning protein [Klugiella xanthotipulae]
MAAKKRTGLGRGIGALIPNVEETGKRPVDIFFNSQTTANVARDTQVGEIPEKSVADTTAPSVEAPIVPASTAPEHELVQVPGARLAQLSPSDIVPNSQQPRTEFAPEALAELEHSIREFGVLQPIVVRPIEPTPPAGQPQYELIMGERRLRASKAVGRKSIPAVIRETADEDMLRDALLENLHRAELNPLEEASAYQQLLADFGITQEQLAQKIGRSRPQISNTMRLLQLPENVQNRVAAGVLSAGHARAILSLGGDPTAMTSLADKIVNEDLSVRAAEAVASQSPQRKNKPKAGGRLGQLNVISERLGDRLDTRVRINLGAKKGQIVIEFATVQDMNRILNELGDPGFGA